MQYGIAVRHPEHVHFFSNPARELLDRGHDVRVYARENGHTAELLEHYGLPHELLAREGASTLSLVGGHALYEGRLAAAARREGVDVLASVGGRAVSHVAPLVGARSVTFVDWEGGFVDDAVAALSDVVCTPDHLDAEFGPGQVRYSGLHELSYLHPENFQPSAAAVRGVGLDPSESLFVVGFRDREGQSGAVAERVVDTLEGRGTVVYAHESAAAGRGDRHTVPATEAHHTLGHADMYVGDSGTMATEAATLGTPSIRLREGMTPEPRCELLQREYGLLYSTADADALLDEVRSIATDPGATDRWRHRREGLLDDTVDVAAFVTDLLREDTK